MYMYASAVEVWAELLYPLPLLAMSAANVVTSPNKLTVGEGGGGDKGKHTWLSRV